METRRMYTIRMPYFYQAKHMNDVYLNKGFNYTGQLLKKGTSPELWANPLQSSLYGTLEGLLNYLIESAKMVKKWFSIAHEKDATNIN
jgi:hypothetical protein